MKKVIILLMLLSSLSFLYAKPSTPLAPTDTIRTEYLKIACGQSGLFTIGTTDGRRLLYGFPSEGSTSHTYIRIDGTSHLFGSTYSGDSVSTPLRIEGGALTITWTSAQVDVTQKISIVQGASTGRYDTALIEYFIRNRSSSSHQVGILLEMDTQISSNDAASISTSFGYTGVEQDFATPNIPQYWQAFQQSPTQPDSFLIGQGTLIGGVAVMPDRFCLGPYGTYYSVQWDYTSTGDRYGDSAVLLWWNPISIPNNGTRRVATLYGLGAGSVATGELAMNVTAPLSLTVDSAGVYTPNPFEVNVLVTNTTSSTINNVTTTITLPSGLSLASGETATKTLSPANLTAGATGSASFRVVAQSQTSQQLFRYTVRANGGSFSNSVERTITIPVGTGGGSTAINTLRLNISSIVTDNFPEIKLFCDVVDSSRPIGQWTITDLVASNFGIKEDGRTETITSCDFVDAASGVMKALGADSKILDVAMLVDVSSDMSIYLGKLDTIANMLATQVESTDYDFRGTIITFTSDIKNIHDFSPDYNEFRGWAHTDFVASTENPATSAALTAVSRVIDFGWRANAQHMIILATNNDFAHTPYAVPQIISRMRPKDISALVLGLNTDDHHMLADSSEGQWYPVQMIMMVADSLGNNGSNYGQYLIKYNTHNPTPNGSTRNVLGTVTIDSLSDDYSSSYIAPNSSGLYFNPETTYTRNGLRFSVNVNITGVSNLYDVHYIVNFDNTKLAIDSTIIGEFLARGALEPLSLVTPGTGNVDISLTRNGSVEGVSGSGNLAKLYFRTTALDPTSRLRFSNVVLRNPAGGNISAPVDTFAYILYLSGVRDTTGSGSGDTTNCMLCDFDCDNDIDTRDFSLLATYWQPNNNRFGDVGPAVGSAPTLTPGPDNRVNFEDLFVFGRMWNWYHLVVLGHPRNNNTIGEISGIAENGEFIVNGVNMSAVAMSHFVIKYDPIRTRIINTDLGSSLPMGFISDDNGIIDISSIKLAKNGEYPDVCGNIDFANINYTGDNTFEIVDIDIRNANGEKVNFMKAESYRPKEFALSSMKPNPFNPVVSFSVTVPEKGLLNIDVYDILGQKLSTLNNREIEKGTHDFSWDASDYPSGVYMIKATYGVKSIIRKAALLK